MVHKYAPYIKTEPRRSEAQKEGAVHSNRVRNSLLSAILANAGQSRLDGNVGNDETQYFGNAIAAEPRYCGAIMMGAGLVVR
jgi:hypothetical protein